MAKTTVSTTAALEAALYRAKPGDTILLQGGTYANLALYNLSFAQNVTIKSLSASNPATLTGLAMGHVSGVTFSNLIFSTAGTVAQGVQPKTVYPFIVNNSSNINFVGITARGDPNGTLATQVSGLQLNGCANCSITYSSFEYFHNAISDLNDNGLTISNNRFKWIFDDGVRGGGTSNVTISNNFFTDMHYDPTDTDHPDCVQFWTTDTTASASNITVTNNTFVRGDGGLVHGIFFKDEVGDLPYQNVNISGNRLYGVGWDGISVTGANNIAITNNTVAPYIHTLSRIWLQNAANATVTGNRAGNYVYTNDPGLVASSNIVLREANPTAALVQAMAGMGAGASGDLVAQSDVSPSSVVSLAVAH
jgi:parallel beta-helix repeat protein